MLLHISFILPITQRGDGIWLTATHHGGHHLESAKKGNSLFNWRENKIISLFQLVWTRKNLLQLVISSCALWLHWMRCTWVFRLASSCLAPSASRAEWRPSSRRCGRSWRNLSTTRSSRSDVRLEWSSCVLVAGIATVGMQDSVSLIRAP